MHAVKYDMIYLLTAIGLPPCGSSTVHIHTNSIYNDTYPTIHRKYFGTVLAVLRLGVFYTGICLTTEEKARKNLETRKNLRLITQ